MWGHAAAVALFGGTEKSGRPSLLIVDVRHNARSLLGNRRPGGWRSSSPTALRSRAAESLRGQRAAPGAHEQITIDQSHQRPPRFRVIGLRSVGRIDRGLPRAMGCHRASPVSVIGDYRGLCRKCAMGRRLFLMRSGPDSDRQSNWHLAASARGAHAWPTYPRCQAANGRATHHCDAGDIARPACEIGLYCSARLLMDTLRCRLGGPVRAERGRSGASISAPNTRCAWHEIPDATAVRRCHSAGNRGGDGAARMGAVVSRADAPRSR